VTPEVQGASVRAARVGDQFAGLVRACNDAIGRTSSRQKSSAWAYLR